VGAQNLSWVAAEVMDRRNTKHLQSTVSLVNWWKISADDSRLPSFGSHTSYWKMWRAIYSHGIVILYYTLATLTHWTYAHTWAREHGQHPTATIKSYIQLQALCVLAGKGPAIEYLHTYVRKSFWVRRRSGNMQDRYQHDIYCMSCDKQEVNIIDDLLLLHCSAKMW
jgi:hypothetical protein